MANIKAGDDIFFTKTMAEVLEKQGYYDDALTIYKILADSAQADAAIAEKIERLKGIAEKRRRTKSVS